MATVFAAPYFTAVDGAGRPVLSASLTFYASGTTELEPVYADAEAIVPLLQPVRTDSAGRAPSIFIDAERSYRLIVRNAAGAVVRDIDPIRVGDGLRTDLLLETGAGGAAIITVLGQIIGAVARPVSDKLADTINVFDVMPASLVASIRAGTVVNLTPWLNIATGASLPHNGNSTNLKRIIVVSPAPNGYRLGDGNTSVYLRKGQTLELGSMGAVFFDLAGAVNNTVPIVQCGQGADGSVDPGGLSVEVAGGFWFGGPASAPVINMETPSGWFLRDAFFTSPGIGVFMGGGDGRVSRCQFDQGLTGVVLSGQNNVIDNCFFYLLNTQIRCDAAIDCEINACHFEYPIITSVQLGAGSGQEIRALTIRGNSFTMNAQYGSFTGYLSIACNNSKVDVIGGNTFKNCPGFAVNSVTGLGNKILVDGGVFDGVRSNVVYDQSTTMGGINATNTDITIRNNTFRNLPGQPIAHAGTFDTQTIIGNNRFDGNTGGTSEILITGSNFGGTARSVIVANVGSGRLLVNAQAVVPVSQSANF